MKSLVLFSLNESSVRDCTSTQILLSPYLALFYQRTLSFPSSHFDHFCPPLQRHLEQEVEVYHHCS